MWGSLRTMARKLRVEYPGAVYLVMNRGDRRKPIFRDVADRQRFVNTLGEACGKTGWQVHALCLMPNHFHMVVETPRGNLVAGMKWFLGTYTGRFNRRHKLFQEVATRLVFGGGEVPEGVVGADEGANGSGTLRGGAGRDDGGARRRDCGGRNETASVERKGVGTPSQR